jgi:ferredoxin
MKRNALEIPISSITERIETMKAKVDESLCSGCGVCVDVCPDVFEMGDEDLVVVKVDPVPSDMEQDCQDAADQCPCDAIIIES